MKRKLQGEQTVKAELKEYFIVRIALGIRENGNNFREDHAGAGEKTERQQNTEFQKASKTV